MEILWERRLIWILMFPCPLHPCILMDNSTLATVTWHHRLYMFQEQIILITIPDTAAIRRLHQHLVICLICLIV
uniref:Putative secreted protein n=1 Tax=Xenopsylla cheopis TaxID=163159 RepID=A0A6M2DXQ6_XENCH